MNIEHKLYPYPVLTYFNDDYLNSIFMAKVEVEKGIGKIGVSLEAVTDDLGLLGLINDGYAEFVFRIECLATLYREIVKSGDGKKKIFIPEEKIDSKITVSTYIVAKKNIENYTNVNFNEDYSDISFFIEKSSILAIARQFKIHIEKENDNLGEPSSIFCLVRNTAEKEEKEVKFDIMGNKIKIILPKEEYENIAMLSQSKPNQEILHSSLIFSALVYVLENLKTDDYDNYDDYVWFRTIKKVLENLEIELNWENIESYQSYSLAQKIINYPIGRSLEAMKQIGAVQEEGEDE
jgi:hypothetical protein